MYYHAYQCCKKKHNIIEDFNTDEDFVTNDEAANLEDPAQDGSQTGEGVTITGANGENTPTTNLAPVISPYWQKTLARQVSMSPKSKIGNKMKTLKAKAKSTQSSW